ncbi:hypothetical protein J3F84DRAFT_269595 [Trichoderma pleuroticola]
MKTRAGSAAWSVRSLMQRHLLRNAWVVRWVGTLVFGTADQRLRSERNLEGSTPRDPGTTKVDGQDALRNWDETIAATAPDFVYLGTRQVFGSSTKSKQIRSDTNSRVLTGISVCRLRAPNPTSETRHNRRRDLEPDLIESRNVANQRAIDHLVCLLHSLLLHLAHSMSKSAMRTCTDQDGAIHALLDSLLGKYLPLLSLPAASGSPCSKTLHPDASLLVKPQSHPRSASSCMINSPAISQPSAALNLPTREGAGASSQPSRAKDRAAMDGRFPPRMGK